jgi:outer membrane protein OmpA-like peptidoglycan-associated protein
MSTTTFHGKRSALVVALAAAALLGACASTPPTNAKLDQARADYNAASSDPQVARTAPAELHRADEALQQADAAQRDKKDTATVDHYAYLATQRVANAQQSAQLASAEMAVTNNGVQRDHILLDARTQEADAQRSRADAQQAQAQQAQRMAQDQAMAADAARQQAAASADRANALQGELLAMNAQQTQRGLVLTLGDVLFDSGRATLNPGAGHTIEQLAQFLRENPDRTVQVEGYTDSVGSDSLNQSLSEQRADSVKSALMDRGVGFARISARGFGKSNPVATNATEAGRQQNRRIEIVVSNASS